MFCLHCGAKCGPWQFCNEDCVFNHELDLEDAQLDPAPWDEIDHEQENEYYSALDALCDHYTPEPTDDI